jgi:two-component system sensor histidine kinase VicK
MGLLNIFGKSAAGSSTVLPSARSMAILNAIQDGVIVITTDGIIRVMNPAASQITTWPAAEAIGLDYRSIISLVTEKGEPRPEELNPFAKVFTGTPNVREELAWISSRNHKLIPISIVISQVVEEAGKPVDTIVVVFRDITAQRDADSQRSDFISTASHEMRTPITAIEGYLALSLNEKICKIDENARKYLEKASRATKDLGVLFSDLLTSSKADDGRLVSYPVVIELGEILEQIIDGERLRAKEKSLDLQYVLSGDEAVNGGKVIRPLFYCYADPHRIKEVVQNIIDNAIKYTISGGIIIRLTGNGSVIQIQVQDSGQGIPEDDIPHLFQKFYRVDSSLTRSVGGTGLGLYICKKIIELYNGQVWVESTLGKGSTFFINLPRLSTEQALEKQKHQASTISPLDTPR